MSSFVFIFSTQDYILRPMNIAIYTSTPLLLMVCYSVPRTQFTYVLCHGRTSTLSQHEQGSVANLHMPKDIYRLTELLGHGAVYATQIS